MNTILLLSLSKTTMSILFKMLFFTIGYFNGRALFDWYLKHKKEKENGVIFTLKDYIVIGLIITGVFVLNTSIIVGSYFVFIAN